MGKQMAADGCYSLDGEYSQHADTLYNRGIIQGVH